jgi:hypothetical protein
MQEKQPASEPPASAPPATKGNSRGMLGRLMGKRFKEGGMADKKGRAMKKTDADAMGRAMTKKPKKMMGGGMMGGGMTRGYKKGGMAKKGC